MFLTTASIIGFMQSAARARSISSNKLIRTRMQTQPALTQRVERAPDFSSPNETFYLSPCHTAVRNKRRFAVTQSNDLPDISDSERTSKANEVVDERTPSWFMKNVLL